MDTATIVQTTGWLMIAATLASLRFVMRLRHVSRACLPLRSEIMVFEEWQPLAVQLPGQGRQK